MTVSEGSGEVLLYDAESNIGDGIRTDNPQVLKEWLSQTVDAAMEHGEETSDEWLEITVARRWGKLSEIDGVLIDGKLQHK